MGLNGRHHSPEERNKVTGRFVKGHKALGGRPLGSRNRLATSFLDDLQRQWAKSGKKALERTAEDDPVAFTKIVAGLLPREMLASVISVNTNVDVSLFADAKDFAEAFRLARQHIGADPPLMIEATVEDEEEPDESESAADAEPNPFEGFSMAEICGFIHRKEGEAGLRQLLAMFDDLTREFLEDAASELEAAGLSKPAAILTSLAAEVPSELDSANPYAEADRLNWASWRNSWFQRRKRRAGGIEADLRAQNLRNQQQAQPTRH